jgi:hypothetical protein
MLFRPIRSVALAAAAALALPAAAQKPSDNPFNDRIRKMNAEQQRAVMRQAITNNAQRCGRVERARFQGPYGNLMMWTATCAPGGDYAVFVGRDQSVQVRVCNQMAALKLPKCRLG